MSAAAQAGVDPISDAGCLAGSVNLLVNTVSHPNRISIDTPTKFEIYLQPASCAGCESALAATGVGKTVSGAISSAKSAIGGAVNSAESAIEGLF